MLWGLRPVDPKPVYGLAVDLLLRQIHTGLLLPAERLPAERQLSEKFGISRMTLREALRILETRRYITVRRGAQGGAFVTDRMQLNQMAHRRLSRAPAVAMRIVEFLAINQLAAARLAAVRRSTAHLKRLAGAADMIRRAPDAPLRKQAETLFFLGIGDAAQNPLLARAIEDGLAELFLPFEGVAVDEGNSGELPILFDRFLFALEAENVEGCTTIINELHERLWQIIRNITRHGI